MRIVHTITLVDREGNGRNNHIYNYCYWAIPKSSIDDIEMVGGDGEGNGRKKTNLQLLLLSNIKEFDG